MVYRLQYIEIPNPKYVEYPDYGKGKCKVCGAVLVGHQRRYCGPECQTEWFIHGRKIINLFWNDLRRQMLRKYGVCQECGSNDHLEVHHIIPLYLDGDQFDEKNLRVLCYECHKFAHRTLPKTLNRLKDRDKGADHYIQMTLDTIVECGTR
jgi:5-methylcytosine-specific restriction endonuclease McrA